MKSVFLILFWLYSASCSVPVLIWGPGSFDVHVPALKKLSSSELYDLLGDLDAQTVALFVEQSLSAEDFASGQLSHVHDSANANGFAQYIPAAETPLKAFEAFVEGHNNTNDGKRLNVVYLEDAQEGESRAEMLHRHDAAIANDCAAMTSKGAVACALTGMRASWIAPESVQRSVRHLLATEESVEINVYTVPTFAMIYTEDRPLLLLSSNNYTLKAQNTSATNDSLGVQMEAEDTSSKATSECTVSFKFNVSDSAWSLISAKFEIQSESGELTPNLKIGASIGHSFHTPSNVTFSNEKYKMMFKGLQAEYFNGTAHTSFSIADDTVNFFTIPILSGLFVTTILVIITMIGLSMIYDIKTMDQFDDPKGKTVIINASE